MSQILYISERVLREIRRDIAAHPPERGGAILGPAGQTIITHFILDEWGRTSSASYTPSQQLTARVQQIELKEGIEFKGVIHSHPGNYDSPSGPDEGGMLEGLNLNPHMPFFVAPIVTMQRGWRGEDVHELRIDEGKISCYAGYRDRGRVRVEKIQVQKIGDRELERMVQATRREQTSPAQQMPVRSELEGMLKSDLERLCRNFGSSKSPEVFVTKIEGRTLPAARVILRGGLELLFLFSDSYPSHAPILLITPEGGNTEQFELRPWLLQTPAEERLLTAVKSIIEEGSGSYQKVYRPLGKSPLTADRDRACLAGWVGGYSGKDPKIAATEIQKELFSRSQGLLSHHISSKRVLIAGTGSVGSYMAEQLVRSGVGAFTLIDSETVELANLCRTTYDVTDVGDTKVEALARRLLNINPLAEVTRQPKSISDFDVSEFAALVQQADLVVAATDDSRAQRVVNHFAYYHRKPGLFVGLYKGAQGGEVIYTIPDRTPCYLCATLNRHQAEEYSAQRVSADEDYGNNGRIMGEVALAADIHHVSSVAVKMALSLLLPEDADVKLKGFLNSAIESKFFYLTLSMVPNYWFYPHVFKDTAGQSAYQSVWMTPERRAECPVCGHSEHRQHPRSVSLRAPSAQEILASARRFPS